MQTYTHYLITALLDRKLTGHSIAGTPIGPDTPPSDLSQTTGWRTRLPPVQSGWLLLGSVAPDIPLILIALIFLALDLAQGCALGPSSAAQATSVCLQPDGRPGSHVGYLFETQFFHTPWVMAAHNLFHAPLMVLSLMGMGLWAWRSRLATPSHSGAQNATQKSSALSIWGARLFWFGIACLLHTAIDIPLHYDDGPLIFFPLDWETRVYSPVSYWDPTRFGNIFLVVEHVLALGMLLYLAVDWARRRKPGS